MFQLAVLALAALGAHARTTSHYSGHAAANCTRASLKEATDRYVATQSTGQINYLKAVSDLDRVSYLENFNGTNIKTGVLSQALKIDHARSIYDTVTCASYTELIITDPKHPYVIGTQIHFTGPNITKIESVVTDADDWLFSAKHTLHYALPENWETIPVEKRDSRATIQAAADAYLDLFNNKSVVVPWGYPCARLEGGLYTAKGLANDSCAVGVPSGVPLTRRRYVIDESIGTVDVLLAFGNTNNGLPDSHEFRVEGGKLRYVHTITACASPNCGMKVPAELSIDPGF